MTVLGDAIRRTWGESVWTSRDLLRPRRVSLDLSEGGRLDVSIPPCAGGLDDRTLKALRDIGEATLARMRFGDATAAAIGEQELGRQ